MKKVAIFCVVSYVALGIGAGGCAVLPIGQGKGS